MKTLRSALLASIPSICLALAAAIFILSASTIGTAPTGWDIASAIAIFFAMAPWPGLAILAAFPGWPATYNLGLPAPRQETRIVSASAAITGLAVLGYAFLIAGDAPLAMRSIVAGIALALAAATSLRLVVVFRRAGKYRPGLQRAVSEFAPEFILYMGRRDGGIYQVKQWLPQILAITSRVIVVVRDPEAAKHLAGAIPSEVPIICCRENRDLDNVMQSSVRAVFYVNSVTSNANLVSYRQVKHVYLGHGDSDKEISAHPVHRMYDAIFVAGQAAIDRYAAENINLDPSQAHIIGRPQLERITVSGSTREPQTLLYAPTWSGYNQATSLSSLDLAVPFITDLLARGITVLFRPHPFSRFSARDRKNTAVIDKLLENEGSPHLVSDVTRKMDLLELFNESDALVTDVSSVLVDYLASRKPAAVLLPSSWNSPDGYETDVEAKFPSVKHAYRPTSPDSEPWRQFLGPDPMRSARENAASYYLASNSPELFRKAVLSLPATSTSR